ncbi:MAG TPA: hypothetical protein VLM85_07535 [Polyangiaceae bacterium]|nr:hypothetical protein [Polyangiaceae bacterium]
MDLRRAFAWVVVMGALLASWACGGEHAASGGAQSVVICPPGSVLDPQQQNCVAMEGAQPVEAADAGAPVEVAGARDAASPTGARDGGAALAIGTADAGAASPIPPPPPPPPGSGFAVDVRCNFPKGWVSLLPANKYPKDDQFLMQALIGLTSDPGFWNGLAEYRPLRPYAARACSATGVTRMMAPNAGDYFLLVGQEGTFSARGTYSNNGVRRKISVRGNQTVSLGTADLTHTWLCISCPWVAFSDGHGHDLEPFVVLANRNARARRGTDAHRVARVPVVDGLVSLRVIEIEQEVSHLDRLVLRVDGRELAPAPRSALARDDGVEVTLRPHTQVSVAYAVPGRSDGFVDVELSATGYYDPL